jgi:hypothetical protein
MGEAERSRFRELRERHREKVLTEAERAELAILEQHVEDAEAAHLAPAVERLRQERETIEAQNRTLERLAIRKEALAQQLRHVLGEAQAERRAIESELAAVLAAGEGSKTDS